MKLYRRGRVWYLTFYVRGKRVQESIGTSDRRKAERFGAVRLSEVERGEYAQSAKITLAQFSQQYWTMRRPTNVRGSGTNRS
jgi:hypothetical protein